jgi:hypothetical protein
MGFIFNLFFVFIIIPLSVIALVLAIIYRKKLLGRILKYFFLVVVFLVLTSYIIRFLSQKTLLKKTDYYGNYIVDRSFFSGKQADWQYENFRFEIKQNDSIFFYVTNKEKILNTFKGTISTVKPYSSERLVIHMKKPTHHVVKSNPTTYRKTWSFYLVFKSEKFRNMFFKKGEWKPIDSK